MSTFCHYNFICDSCLRTRMPKGTSIYDVHWMFRFFDPIPPSLSAKATVFLPPHPLHLGSLRWRWLIFSLAVHQQILPEMSVCRLSGQLPAVPPNQYFDPGPMSYCVDIIYGSPLKQRGVEPSIIHSYGASERTGAMPGRRGDQQHEAHRAN